MAVFSDLVGTTLNYLRVGINGFRLKNSSGNLIVRNAGDSADSEVTASKVNISGESLVLNSDSAGSGADWKVTLQRATSGMSADVTYTLPPDDGTAGQVMTTDGTGVLTWVSAGNTGLCEKVDTTSLAFGTGSPLSLFSTGAADVINKVEIIVDTAFDGSAPTLSIGVSGTTSKYAATTHVDLKSVGVYEIHPGLTAQGAEALIATYVPDSSAAGAARIQVYYATPA